MAVTVYTPSPAFNTNDNNVNTNFRVLVQLASASNGSLQVRFRASSGGTDTQEIYGASFGKWDGTTLSSTNCNMTTTPFRLTFAGGSNNTTVATNSTVTSDLIAHPGVTLSAGDWVIVAYYNQSLGSAQAGQRYSGGHTTATTMFKAESGLVDRSQDQNIASGGWGIVGSVQPGGSGGYNFTVDLVETNDPVGSPYTLTADTGTVALAGQAATLSTTAAIWTFVGVTEAAISASGNYTLTEPAGVAQDDLLIVDFAVRGAVIYTNAAWTFTQSDTGGNTTNATTASDTSFQAGYCIRGASPPSYVFTRTGGSRALGTVRAYRSTKGVPVFDTSAKFAQTTASSTITMNPSVTTAATNELIVSGGYIARAAGGANNASNMVGATNLTGASGAIDTSIAPQISAWTERSDRGNATSPTVALACYDAVKPTSGATGSLSVTGPASALHGMVVMAFQHATSVIHYTMSAGTGTVTCAGQAVTLRVIRKLVAGQGTLTLAGQSATLKRSYVMPAATGTLTLSGQTSALKRSYVMPAATGTLTLSGQTAALRYAHKMPAGQGTLTLSGQVVTTRFAHRTVAGLGTLTLAGQTAIVRYERKMPAGQGTLTPSGQNVTLRYSRKMPAGLGTITLAGPVVNLIYSGAGSRLLPAGLGILALAGQPVTLCYARKMPAALGTITLAGQAVALQRARKITVDAGAIVLEGKAAGLNYEAQARLFAETSVLSLTGCDVTMPITRRPPVMVQENLRFGRSVYVSRW